MNKARHLCPDCKGHARRVFYREQKNGKNETINCGFYCLNCKLFFSS